MGRGGRVPAPGGIRMLNTGVMPETREASATDLNADLAEGDRLTAGDLGVLDAVTSASLACGFHAGGPQVMRDTASACVAREVTIGAHVSYRDRDGFGRRVREVSPAELTADLVEQWGVLTTQVHAVGGAVAFVKPHGALYHQMGTEPAVADAVVQAVVEVGGRTLVAQAGTLVVDRAREAGLRVVPEGFPDRAQLIARYEQRSGRPVGDVRWYTTLALWKSVVFMEGNYKRAIAGTVDDPYLRQFGDGVLEIAMQAQELVDGV